MNFIEPGADIIDIVDPLKRIERIGRLCYRSEEKIGDGTAKRFVDMLISRNHFAMLEHAVAHFMVTTDHIEDLMDIPNVIVSYVTHSQWLVTVSLSHLYNPQWDWSSILAEIRTVWETGENSADIQKLLCVPTKFKFKHDLVSILFTCDRGVSHELVRHRCAVAQESTRYCNYASDKFGHSINFIAPSTYSEWSVSQQVDYEFALETAENCYFRLIDAGRTPQEARAVLPNSLATHVVLSMTPERWEHFFDLRSRGTTGSPHPDMKQVADIALSKFREFVF